MIVHSIHQGYHTSAAVSVLADKICKIFALGAEGTIWGYSSNVGTGSSVGISTIIPFISFNEIRFLHPSPQGNFNNSNIDKPSEWIHNVKNK